MSNLSQAIKDVQPIPMSINGILLIPPNSNVICIKWMVFLAFIRGYIILGRPQSTLSSRCRYKSNSFFRINQYRHGPKKANLLTNKILKFGENYASDHDLKVMWLACMARSSCLIKNLQDVWYLLFSDIEKCRHKLKLKLLIRSGFFIIFKISSLLCSADL